MTDPEASIMAIGKPERREGGWTRLDASAFGLIYGSVTVLALLMAMGAHPDRPLASAVIVFGSVLAISLAKAFAELMSNAIDKGDRITRHAIAASWSHARTTLIAANLPTLIFLVSATGLWTVERAVALSQIFCVALLMLVGARVGWRLDGSRVSALLGALFAGAVGVSLALLKYVIH